MSTASAKLEISSDPVPLVKWPDGSVRVTGTRLLFNVVIGIYQQEGTVEGLREALPDLPLPEAHRLVAYYLAHQPEVDAWMEQLDREADEIWAKLEQLAPTGPLREKLKILRDERRASAVD